jgi:hypothetical protein
MKNHSNESFKTLRTFQPKGRQWCPNRRVWAVKEITFWTLQSSLTALKQKYRFKTTSVYLMLKYALCLPSFPFSPTFSHQRFLAINVSFWMNNYGTYCICFLLRVTLSEGTLHCNLIKEISSPGAVIAQSVQWLDTGCKTGVKFPLHRVQIGSVALPASYLMSTGDLSPRVKRTAREADHTAPSSAEIKHTWSYTSTPPYIFTAWCLLKHRDNFIFSKSSIRKFYSKSTPAW